MHRQRADRLRQQAAERMSAGLRGWPVKGTWNRRSGRMQLGIYGIGTDSAGSRKASAIGGGRLSGKNYADAAQNSIWTQVSSRIQELARETEKETKKPEDAQTVQSLQVTGSGEEDSGAAEKADGGKRSEASKIYEAAVAGKSNPISSFRAAPKVPYGHLAKDGVITYNGVTFVCDEKTNSICLGNMEDKSQVITVALSGGGHLKVNRNNIGDLSKAVGMFSPEDLNLIMRAIAQDTKIQSVKKEIDDMENSIGSAENAISGEPVSEDAASGDMASENVVSGEEKEKNK
ncbi:MAG: hypothetical protein NC123_01900 [Butyrivibrio sp.]|nr:hypothetical protein [Acetatifactor muris]MCM1558292.1 hypothetical protein [Butyrivibrio sp.]